MSRHVLIAVLSLSLFSPLAAHQGAASEPAQPPPPEFKLQKLTDRAWCLFGQGGNVGFLVTDSGVLVVDDQFERVAQGIVDQIRSVTDKPIRYQVNTHYHADHTGGNPVFIKLAAIIAHDSVRTRLLTHPETVKRTFPGMIKEWETHVAAIADPADPYRVALENDLGLAKWFLQDAEKFSLETAAPPALTYEGRMKVWLGDQEVEIFHVAPGHTDGDSMVFFRNEKVLHMGDLFFNGMVPFVDALGGGSVEGYIESIDYALAHVPRDTIVIPGHGPVSDLATLKRARDFLSDLRVEVDRAVRSGMTRPDAIRAIKMETYPDIKPAFRSLGNVIAVIYDEMKSSR